jgi:hypothetical protein
MHLYTACIVGFLACRLNAGSIYDNTSAVSNGADCIEVSSCGFHFPGQLYDSFTTGAAGQLIDLDLDLAGESTSSGAVEVGLYADSSTEPGALIANLGSLSDSELSSAIAIQSITLTANPFLEANTRYWIGLSGTTTAEWSWSFDVSGPGVAGEFFSNPNGTFNSSDGLYQMSVGTGSSSPEPPGVLLIVAGTGLLGLLRRRSGRETDKKALQRG